MNSLLSDACRLIKVRSMHTPMLARFLLIFALLFVQLGSVTHSLSHVLGHPSGSAGQSQSSDQSLPHDKYCDLCAAYAQIGGALGSRAIPFTLPEQPDVFAFTSPHTFHSNTFSAFAARAPPYSA